MGIASKEERVLELFMNEPTKHWHFSQILSTAKVSRRVASRWLNNIIKHINPEGKMPYFQGNWEHVNYKNQKRIYALNKLYETGLLNELWKLENAKTIVIFGSFTRGDWNTESDVDVFIFGDSENFKFGRFWKGLGFQGKSRQVQVHTFKDKQEIKDVRSGLMKNIAQGYFVKGSIHDIMELAA
jgi:hypothetical protein